MTVTLVGAGPGTADLLTLRAARALANADVVVADRLVDKSVLELVNDKAELIFVGKRPGESHLQCMINDLLVSLGASHRSVVRLKGGDPFVFGRGGEEIVALRRAGIEVDVVPGITSAFAAPLAAEIPVTHRGVSRGVLVVTGHLANGQSGEFATLICSGITMVVLMGVEHRADIAAQLLGSGVEPDMPVAAIESAYTPRQRVVRTTLREVGDVAVSAPAVIVIGDVVHAIDSELVEHFASLGV
jgi:uroporphyrin-III C-methyltransferase